MLKVLNGCGKVILEGYSKCCVRDGIKYDEADKQTDASDNADGDRAGCSGSCVQNREMEYRESLLLIHCFSKNLYFYRF